ncbi:uncharacterized protein LOC129753371 [Uranotaenia lowii]|uniref:uncharacterized protein LOC129753371 n=1 Tax=Uranotaenia lowii TaxID=190385 RepID=UPI00247B1AA6|nr:uncharacterized protein LOC129753371 [Uranotaenia lowii]
MDENISQSFLNTQETAFRNNLNRKNKKTAHKLQQIIDRTKNQDQKLHLNEKAILNRTEVEIPGEVTTLLSLGPKFALPPNKINDIPFYHILADLEGIITTNNNERIQNTNRCRTVNIIENYIHGFNQQTRSKDPINKFFQHAKLSTKSFMKNHPEICVLSADKGNRTVIMNSKDYHQKMSVLVNDTKTYRQVNRDPTGGFQTKNNNFVKRLLNLKLIDKFTGKRLTIYNATCPRIYGQPKAHKTELPLRPVVPNVTAPTYHLAKYISEILQTSIASPYSCKNSYEFCESVNGKVLPQGYIMISLDVVSLFTNVPRNLVASNIIQHWSEIDTQINLDLFLEIIEFLMNTAYFQYGNKYYVQEYGTAMGSPISPILSELVLDTIITRALKKLPFPIPIIHKYVDDLFLVIPEDQCELVLEIFNQQEERLQFTMEKENENRLPYLDMVVVRDPNQMLKTEWFIKPIASGRMLNWHSCHQLKHKLNVANNFIDRVASLSRNDENQDIIKIIRHHLTQNNYPIKLINRMINTNQKVQRHKSQNPNHQSTHQPIINQQSQLSSSPINQNNNRTSNRPATNQHNLQPQPHNSPMHQSTLCQQDSSEMPTITTPDISSPADPTSKPDIPRTVSQNNINPSRIEEHHISTSNMVSNSISKNTTSSTANAEVAYRSVTYVPFLTERLIQCLKKDYPNVKIATRRNLTVGDLYSRVKDPKSIGSLMKVLTNTETLDQK